jgi:hypothetical protein
LTPEQRSFWADLLALAGHSRFPGVVTPGEDGSGFVAYPSSFFCSTFGCPETVVNESLALFEAQKRIRNENGVLYIVNWDKYQSEYQQKRQRIEYKKSTESAANVRTKSQQNSAAVESEVEVEVEVEVEKKENQKHLTPSALLLPSWLPIQEWEDFIEMRKKIKAPLTERGKKLIIGKLENLSLHGEIVAEVLKQSIERSWRGVFPVTTNAKEKDGRERIRQTDQAAAAFLRSTKRMA